MNYSLSERVTIDFSNIYLRKSGYIITLNNAAYEPPRCPWNISIHCHSSFEIHFITSGMGWFTVDNVKYKVEQGNVIITGPDIYHSQSSELTDSMEEYCINISISETNDDHNYNSCDEDIHELIGLIIKHPFYIGGKIDIANEYHELLVEALEMDYGYKERIASYVNSIILRIARLIEHSEGGTHLHVRKITSKNINRRMIIDRYCRYNLNGIDIDELCEILYISRRQLSRIVKELYGMTLTEKLNIQRLEYARHLLLSTDMTVSDIAADSGFSSTQYFYRLFSEKYHTSPAKLRR
ncbi:MAG: helix-turn-helix domain-containing protein [Clostridiales bacterium]|nr:helix-turn-helix domain-containing protein [Clostridiales bacterium]